MLYVGIREAKARFSELIDLVRAGEEVTITRRSVPIARLVSVVEVRAIRTEEDYEAALGEIERLFAARPGTPEGDRLEALITQVEAWEEAHHAIRSTTSLP